MTDPREPADGGYVAVRYRTSSDGDEVLVCRRDDQAAGGSDEHWFIQDDRFGTALTWEQLAMTGPIAYVGEFVDRSGVSV